jgi:putative spermidine/putrescine transport system permease protein
MTTSGQTPTVQPAATRRRGGLARLVLLPFAVIVVFFLVIPALSLLWGSFHVGGSGAATLANYDYLSGANKSLQPFINSFIISLASMISGGVLGLIIAQALVSSKNRVLEQLTITFSSVAANFAGVPLAFAYVAMIGVNGLLTRFLAGLGVNLYGAGFTIYSLTGLAVVYTYFQVPLMVLLILPALQAMRREWREASDNLGASRSRYVRSVAIPVLTPSLIASLLLLFANSFGAYATAYALTTGFISLVPIAISNVIAGDVTFNPGQGDALAMGLAVVMTLCVAGQAILQRRASRWLNR